MRPGAAGVGFLSVLGLLLLAPAPAAAHVALQSSTPAKGSTVEGPVRELRLRFSQPVEPRYLTATVLGAAGEQIAGPAEVVPMSNGRELALSVGELGAGGYVVRWRAVSKDGHVVTGRFAFTATAPSPAVPTGAGVTADGTAAAPASTAPPAPGAPPVQEELSAVDEEFSLSAPLPVIIRWLHFLALLGMIGAVAFRSVVLPVAGRRGAAPSSVEPVDRRAWTVGAGATALLWVAIVGRLWVQSASMHGEELAWDGAALRHLLLGTGWGKVWLLQVAAGVTYGGGLLLTRRGQGAAGALVLGLGALALSLVPPLSGHAATVEQLRVLAVVADALHVLGAGAWLGTLLVLLLAVTLRPGDGHDQAATPLALVTAFSPVALVSSAVTGVSGVVNALFQLTAVAQLWTTDYGVALLVKLGAVGLVAAVGFYNWRWVLPALATGAPPRKLVPSARVELLAAAAVVLVTAILVALPTPRP